MTLADILGELYGGDFDTGAGERSQRRYIPSLLSPSRLVELSQAKSTFGGGEGMQKKSGSSGGTNSGSPGGPPGVSFGGNSGLPPGSGGGGSLGGSGGGGTPPSAMARSMPGVRDYDPRQPTAGYPGVGPGVMSSYGSQGQGQEPSINDILQQLINSQAFGF